MPRAQRAAVTRLVLLIAMIVSNGCAAAACELMHHNESFISQCKASSDWGIDEEGSLEADARNREVADRSAAAEHTAYEQARPECERGNAHACLAVAVYEERHHGAPTAIVRNYAIACRADLGFGCYSAGRLTSDVALLARGCDLGEAAACALLRSAN
jgi:hypothetical protein